MSDKIICTDVWRKQVISEVVNRYIRLYMSTAWYGNRKHKQECRLVLLNKLCPRKKKVTASPLSAFQIRSIKSCSESSDTIGCLDTVCKITLEEWEGKKKHSGNCEQHGLIIWQDTVEENKYDNMEGKMREEGKEFCNCKLMSFRKDKLLGKKISF